MNGVTAPSAVRQQGTLPTGCGSGHHYIRPHLSGKKSGHRIDATTKATQVATLALQILRHLGLTLAINKGLTEYSGWSMQNYPENELQFVPNGNHSRSERIDAMAVTTYKPIIFLAFASEYADAYLPSLAKEARRLRDVLSETEKSGLCEIVVRQDITFDDIISVFYDRRYHGRITIFHYAGHASPDALLLTDEQGNAKLAYASGLAAFLGGQPGLEVVFLNGCATQPQVENLLAAGVKAVIATNSDDTPDKWAARFAEFFYQGLVAGMTLASAFQSAKDAIRADTGEMEIWPWELSLMPNGNTMADWSLATALDAVSEPCDRIRYGTQPPWEYFATRCYEKFREVYVPPGFINDSSRLRDFIERKWLSNIVDEFLNDPKQTRGVLVFEGAAAVGKTTFLANLVKERNYIHLFSDQFSGGENVFAAIQSFAAQIIAGFGIEEYQQPEDLAFHTADPNFLDRLLGMASAKLESNQKLIIVCDALDEGGIGLNGNVLSLPKNLPDHVYFICSQQPIPIKLTFTNVLPRYERIEPESANNLADIERYLQLVVRRPSIAHLLLEHNYEGTQFVDALRKRSDGSWVYIRYVVDEIERGTRPLTELDKLPQGLVEYYAQHWDSWRNGARGEEIAQDKRIAKWGSLYAPVLSTLAAAQAPLTLHQIQEWSKAQAGIHELRRLLEDWWGPFIDVHKNVLAEPETYRFFHRSLRDFLNGNIDWPDNLSLAARSLLREMGKHTSEAHRRIAQVLDERNNGVTRQLAKDSYARHHLTKHLLGADEVDRVLALLIENPEWADTLFFEEGTYAGCADDLQETWSFMVRNRRLSIDQVVRFALVFSSIQTMTTNVPVELLWILVDTGHWSWDQAIRHIAQIKDDDVRESALLGLASNRPSNERNSLAVKFVDSLEEIQGQRIDFQAGIFNSLVNRRISRKAIIRLVSCLDAKHRDNLLTALYQETIQSGVTLRSRGVWADVAEIIVDFVPHLPQSELIDVLTRTLAIDREWDRIAAIVAIAPRFSELPSDMVRAAVNTVLNTEYPEVFIKGSTIAALIPYLPPDLRNQVSAIFQEKMRSSEYLSQNMYAGATPRLAAIFKQRIRRRFCDNPDGVLLTIALALFADANKRDMILNRVELELWSTLDCDNYDLMTLIEGLVRLAPHLPTPARQSLLKFAVISAQKRIGLLFDLFPLLPTEVQALLKDEMLQRLRIIGDKVRRDVTLSAFVDFLSLDLRTLVCTEALTDTRWLDSPDLAKLFKVLPDEKLLGAYRHYLSGPFGIFASAESELVAEDALARRVADSPKLLEQVIKSFIHHDRFMAVLLPYLAEPQLVQVFNRARKLKDEHERAAILGKLVEVLPAEMTSAAIDTACRFKDDLNCMNVFKHAARRLDQRSVEKAWKRTLVIKHERCRAWAISSLIPVSTGQQVWTALKNARQMQDTWSRIEALSAIAPSLPVAERTSVCVDILETIEHAMTNHPEHQIDVTDTMPFSIRVLKSVATYKWRLVQNAPHTRAEIKALLSDSDSTQDDVMLALSQAEESVFAPVTAQLLDMELPSQIFGSLLSIAGKIKWNWERDRLFHNVRSEYALEMLRFADSIFDDDFANWRFHDKECSRALVLLAPKLPAESISEALSIAARFESGGCRIEAIAVLMPRLPVESRQEIQEIVAQEVAHAQSQGGSIALLGLVPFCTGEARDVVSALILDDIANAGEHFVAPLGLWAKELSDELQRVLLDKIAQRQDEYFRRKLLESVAPSLSASSLPRAFAIAVKCDRLGALESVIERWQQLRFQGLDESIVRDCLWESAQKSRGDLLRTIEVLAPALIFLSGKQGPDKICEAIRSVTQWWP
jgi:hypothetical protein